MSTVRLRGHAKSMIDRMSDAQLRVASESLAFVQTRDADPATLQLLSLPGFGASFASGSKRM